MSSLRDLGNGLFVTRPNALLGGQEWHTFSFVPFPDALDSLVVSIYCKPTDIENVSIVSQGTAHGAVIDRATFHGVMVRSVADLDYLEQTPTRRSLVVRVTADLLPRLADSKVAGEVSQLNVVGYGNYDSNLFAPFVALSAFHADRCNITKFPDFAKSHLLEALVLRWARPLHGIEVLKNFSRLRDLDLGGVRCPLHLWDNLDWIPKHLSGLTLPLDISASQFGNLCNQLGNLTRLEMWDANFADIEPISTLKNLESLDISNSHCGDWTPTMVLPKLKHLALEALGQDKPLKLPTHLPLVTHLSLFNSDVEGFRELVAHSGKLESCSTPSTMHDDDLAALCRAQPTLKSLSVTGSNTLKSVQPIFSLREIEQLTIWNCENVSADKTWRLPTSLRQIGLSINGNAAQAVAANAPRMQLTSIDLRTNDGDGVQQLLDYS